MLECEKCWLRNGSKKELAWVNVHESDSDAASDDASGASDTEASLSQQQQEAGRSREKGNGRKDDSAVAAASASQQDQEPAKKTPTLAIDGQITIQVTGEDGDAAMTFKVRGTTPMSKVFSSYAESKSFLPSNITFSIDNAEIDPTETPNSMELEHNDAIVCVRKIAALQKREEKKFELDAVRILQFKVCNTVGKTTFKVKGTTPMSKVTKAYAKSTGQELGQLRFLTSDGASIGGADTPNSAAAG